MSVLIGYHASHEQFRPCALLGYAKAAREAGFDAVMSSDHLAPWSVRQGNSGLNWSWLGAAMQATDLPFGTLCIPTGGRYHPALVAQAAATLADLAPGRLRWIAAGSGEALNERPLGAGWPPKEERNARLLEGVSMIRRLWAGETVSKSSGYIRADRLRIWSLPAALPKIYGAALSPETAYWMGSWADGLITVRKPLEAVKTIIDAFRAGGGEGKPVVLQFQLGWAASREEALQDAWDQWRHCALDPEQLANLSTPEEFDAATQNVTAGQLDRDLCISARAGDHIEWIRAYAALGFSEIHLHDRGRNQSEFIRFFGQNVLPHLT